MLARRCKVRRATNLLGPRHFGVATWQDVRVASDPRWPLHAKPLHLCSPDRITELASATPLAAPWRIALAFLYDPTAYQFVPVPNLEDARSSLTRDQFQSLLSMGYYTPIPEDRVRGVVRVFTRPEPWKVPPRFRVIHWTYTVNQWRCTPFLQLPRIRDARLSVHHGPYAVSIDVEGCFNQFPYGPEVRDLFCFKTGDTWYSLQVLAMGQRQSVFIAHTALAVIAYPIVSRYLPYVDNLKITGEPGQLRADIASIAARSAHVGIKWNEDLSSPGPLIKTEVEFIGLVLDHTTKMVKCGNKVIAKLTSSWSNCSRWRIRDFLAHCSILFYCTTATGRPLGRHEYILQLWAAAQAEVARGANMRQQFIITSDLDAPLRHWTYECLMNRWEPVPTPSDEYAEPDFVLITDASKRGWAAFLISMKGGQTTIIAGDWPEGFQDFIGHSAESEPIAVWAAINRLFDPSASATITHYGDNTGNRSAVNKGYSTRKGHVVQGLLSEHFPSVRFIESKYCPGTDIPADEPSRGLPVDIDKFRHFCVSRGIPLGPIRDDTGRAPMSPSPADIPASLMKHPQGVRLPSATFPVC